MANLPRNLPWEKANQLWASAIDPVLANLLVQGNIISGIVFVANTPQTLNHLLGKIQTGYWLIDQTAAGLIYRTQPLNSKTITLESNANLTCSIWCF